MRTFRGNAPITIGAGVAALLLVALAPFALMAQDRASAEPVSTASVIIDTESAKQDPTFASLRARLDRSDRTLALSALQVALSELGDGATLIWKRPSRGLIGVIKPISAFRDDSGRVCRHLSYSLSLGSYVRRVEGIACREQTGMWSLQG